MDTSWRAGNFASGRQISWETGKILLLLPALLWLCWVGRGGGGGLGGLRDNNAIVCDIVLFITQASLLLYKCKERCGGVSVAVGRYICDWDGKRIACVAACVPERYSIAMFSSCCCAGLGPCCLYILRSRDLRLGIECLQSDEENKAMDGTSRILQSGYSDRHFGRRQKNNIRRVHHAT
jgi:hypothetical protein